jgi:hypothetical protein
LRGAARWPFEEVDTGEGPDAVYIAPFVLNTKKRYGNLQGKAYVEWLTGFAESFRDLLTPSESIVIELGNAWEPGQPTMSTLAIEALLAFDVDR